MFSSNGVQEAIHPNDAVAFVTARLEDLAAYFLPTIIALQQFLSTKNLFVISCTSPQNAHVKAGSISVLSRLLGISPSHFILLDSPMYRDGLRTSWDIFALVHELKMMATEHRINWMITFDFDGVSEDVTHRKTWRAVRDLYTFERLSLRPFGFKGAFQLVSPHKAIRYLSFCGVILELLRNVIGAGAVNISFWIFQSSILRAIRCWLACPLRVHWRRFIYASASPCLFLNEYERVEVDEKCL